MFCVHLVCCRLILLFLSFFFFNDTATTEIYTLSLHDALPIFAFALLGEAGVEAGVAAHRHATGHADHLLLGDGQLSGDLRHLDRKSTRLNSSHANISYAVFCLKKKIINHHPPTYTATQQDTLT